MTRVAKKAAPATWRHALATPFTLLRPRNALSRAAIAVGVGVAVAFGAPALWRSVRSHVEAQPEYLVAIGDITITPPPPWIRSDVKAHAIRDAGLPESISILDDRVADQIRQALALHPWVARVEKVPRTYPASIHVDVAYRRPVAMVEVAGGLLPIDADGVLLPTGDFSSADVEDYPWISGVTASPRGPVGTRWGDPAIDAAADLAELLRADWKGLQLRRIRLQPRLSINAAEPLQWEFVTRAGTVLAWGAAPGAERGGELKGAKKLARLKRLAADYGALDSTPVAQRDLTRITSQPAAARSRR